jgi:hypothetical protein
MLSLTPAATAATQAVIGGLSDADKEWATRFVHGRTVEAQAAHLGVGARESAAREARVTACIAHARFGVRVSAEHVVGRLTAVRPDLSAALFDVESDHHESTRQNGAARFIVVSEGGRTHVAMDGERDPRTLGEWVEVLAR